MNERKSNEIDEEKFDIEKFSNLISNVLKNINDNKVNGAFFYAFKTKPVPNVENPYITLNYNFYDTRMGSEIVIKAVRNILTYLCEKKFGKEKDIEFADYNINNSKQVVDFIKINKYNFTDDDVLDGSKKDLDPNSYKIEYLLNSIKTNCCIAKCKKDYRGLKHTTLRITTSDNDEITIINKSAPLYRTRSLMYIVDFPEKEEDYKDEEIGFKPVKDTLLTIPFYPHVLIINDYCFFIENNIESLFGFEEYNKVQAQAFLQELPKNVELNQESLEYIKTFIAKGKNYNYFANFDNSRIMNLHNKEAKTIDILTNELKIIFDENGNPIISDLDQAERLINFLCCTIKEDIYSKDKLIAVNYKPLLVDDSN